MPAITIAAFLEEVRRCCLVSPSRLEIIERELEARFPEGYCLCDELVQEATGCDVPVAPGAEYHDVAHELMDRGWLTPYQVREVVEGRGPDLVIGHYVILEPIGRGGAGLVFKARHQKMGRDVALKFIREDQATRAESVERFRREIRAIARLEHPNIVRAYDADQVGNTYFLAMEYVDGINLQELVKKRGALSIAIACDCIRQAALGLQHAHEHGLIHRDIKPSNLLLSYREQAIKLCDLGLTRFRQAGTSQPTSIDLTQKGAVIGTLDYVAPEYALDSHQADIRGDLYSLGCTFYYLITGRVPFPGGTVIEKLLKHCWETPHSLEQLRVDVPYGIAAIVRRLMAKRPEARYQDPAELLADLALASRTLGIAQALAVSVKQFCHYPDGPSVSASHGKDQLPGLPHPSPNRVLVAMLFEGQHADEILRRAAEDDPAGYFGGQTILISEHVSLLDTPAASPPVSLPTTDEMPLCATAESAQ